MTEETWAEKQRIIEELDAAIAADRAQVESLRERLLREPWDSPIWSQIAAILTDA